MDRLILLSFDLEEFDAPIEFGQEIPEETQFDVPIRGMDVILPALDRLGIRATFFVTARFAMRNPALIRKVAEKHEVASHGLRHSGFSNADLKRSREIIEEITGLPVAGFRRPRLAPTDHGLIREAGYRYNSSENPIWLPGRYNNLRSPRGAYFSGELLNIPASVSPWFRVPLFWLAFKNFPWFVIRAASWQTLIVDSYLSIYFHPYEFTDLRSFRLPWYIKRHAGLRMLKRLESYLSWLKGYGRFARMDEFDSFYRRRSR
jgi:peptidoglycan/xylan/chitin deacetylase (PgdA/CDA1 family)